MIRKVPWFMVIAGLLLIVAGVAFAVPCDYRNQDVSTPTPTPTPTSLPEGSFIYEGVLLGTDEHSDYDGDWVSDRLEFWEYGTNPLKIDTDDGGIDDFNEIFTYPHLLDPLDPTDDEEFLAMLPNVKAEKWGHHVGHVGPYTGGTGWAEVKFVEVGKRDPLVQWYAQRTTIEWLDVDWVQGSLTVNGEPLNLKGKRSDSCSPSYYLTQGREGNCLQTSIAHYTILELMGYKCLSITGVIPGFSGVHHAWVEAEIDGRVYVVNLNHVEIADIFYQTHDWTIEYKEDL